MVDMSCISAVAEQTGAWPCYRNIDQHCTITVGESVKLCFNSSSDDIYSNVLLMCQEDNTDMTKWSTDHMWPLGACRDTWLVYWNAGCTLENIGSYRQADTQAGTH